MPDYSSVPYFDRRRVSIKTESSVFGLDCCTLGGESALESLSRTSVTPANGK